MKTNIRFTTVALLALMFTFAGFAQRNSPVADAKVVKMLVSKKKMPVKVTARDLVTKVFGVADHNLSSEELKAQTKKSLDIIPVEDEGNLWLDPTDGYAVSYYGMVPQVSAVAIYDASNGELSNFSYFFLFPYASGERENASYEQCAFCTSLLQEMDDMGMDMGTRADSEALFQAVGNYGENLVNLRLVEQQGDDTYIIDPDMASGEGKYVLVLDVEPNAYTQSDTWTAAE